jgi:hypothetical protein
MAAKPGRCKPQTFGIYGSQHTDRVNLPWNCMRIVYGQAIHSDCHHLFFFVPEEPI